jgi:uncharacterized repeat protein (TIGR02543 family)
MKTMSASKLYAGHTEVSRRFIKTFLMLALGMVPLFGQDNFLRVQVKTDDGVDNLAPSLINAILIHRSSDEVVQEQRIYPNTNPVDFDTLPNGNYYIHVYCWDMLVGEKYNVNLNSFSLLENIVIMPRRELYVHVKEADGTTPIPGARVALDSWNGQTSEWTQRTARTTNADGEIMLWPWATRYPGEKYRLRVSYPDGTPLYVNGNLQVQAVSDPMNYTVTPSVGLFTVSLEPAAARSAGAAWRFTNGPDTDWKSSGEHVYVPGGNYSIEYKNLDDWARPVSENVQINANQSQALTRTYAGMGFLRVNLGPNSALNAGAGWAFESTSFPLEFEGGDIELQHELLDSGTTVKLPAGIYNIWFMPLHDEGFDFPSYFYDANGNPSPIVVEIENGQTVVRQFEYKPFGTLRVDISPQTAITIGGQWAFEQVTAHRSEWWNFGGDIELQDELLDSGTTVKLPAGIYNIWFMPLHDEGFDFPSYFYDANGNPSPIVVEIENGQTVVRQFEYKPFGTLRVDISPQTAITIGGQWAFEQVTAHRSEWWNFGGDIELQDELLDSGTTVKLPAGIYNIWFMPLHDEGFDFPSYFYDANGNPSPIVVEIENGQTVVRQFEYVASVSESNLSVHIRNATDTIHIPASDMNAILVHRSIDDEEVARQTHPSSNPVTFENLPTGTYYVDVYSWDMLSSRVTGVSLTQASHDVTALQNYRRPLKVFTYQNDGATPYGGAEVFLYSWNGQFQQWNLRGQGMTSAENGNSTFLGYPTTQPGESYRLVVHDTHGNIVADLDNVTLADDENGSTYTMNINTVTPDHLYPWTRFGDFELWASLPVDLHRPIPQATLNQEAFRIAASVGGAPVMDTDFIGQLAVAAQTSLVSGDMGFWGLGYIDPSDIRQVTSKGGTAPSGIFSPYGEYSLATPPANSSMWAASFWEWNNIMNLGSFLNSNIRFYVPNHPEYISRINQMWSQAGDHWRHADKRRDLYKKTFLFSMFPESGAYANLSAEIRHRYRNRFDSVWESNFGDLDASVTHLTAAQVSLYLDDFGRSFSSEHPGLSQYLLRTKNLVAAAVQPSQIFAPAANSLEKQRIVVETLVMSRIQEQLVRERISFLESVINTPMNESAILGGYWTNNIGGWQQDPAMLFGFFDAKAEVESILNAIDSDSMALALFHETNPWFSGAADVSHETAKLILNDIQTALLDAAGIIGSKAAFYFKASVSVVTGMVNLANRELLELSEALRVMFTAATLDQFIETRSSVRASNSLENVRYNQLRSNVRLSLGALFYSSYGYQARGNVFYGTGSNPWISTGNLLLTTLVNDSQITNPLTPELVGAISQKGMAVSSVPGTINPIGHFQLTVSAGSGGTTGQGGFFQEGSTVTISASPDTGYVFQGWTGSGISNPATATTTVSMTQNRSVTANFTRQWLVSVNAAPAEGGSVLGGGFFLHGQNAPISANPAPGFRFGGWSGASGISNPSSPSTTVYVAEEKTLNANFIRVWSLSVESTSPNLGSVQGQGTYDDGTLVVIRAIPADGYTFSGWHGEGVQNPNSAQTTVTMTQNRTVSASFVLDASPGYREFANIFGDETDPAKIGPSADFSQDGLTNFVCYAFGINPLVPSTERPVREPIVHHDEGTARLGIEVVLRANDPDLSYRVMLSNNVLDWTRVGISYSNGVWTSANPARLQIQSQQPQDQGLYRLILIDQPDTPSETSFMSIEILTP